MSVAIRADREGDHARLVPTGPFDLAHAIAAARAVENAQARLSGCVSVDIDLAQLDRIDGAGAVLLARLFDRLDAEGHHARIIEGANRQAARLIARYRERRGELPGRQTRVMSPLTRIGELVADVPSKATEALDFTGRCATALPKAAATPSSVDWPSLPRLIQEIGADALWVTSAANLLVGVIIGFLGVSQLGHFGALAYVPGLVVVAHFRELGPLVTAIVVAGRSGAGLASEIATMKVSEEIDALRSLGFDPIRWHLNMIESSPHITVDNLRIGWGTRVLMENVSFQVERGAVFAILGGSGSGKSTLLRYLIGLERPKAGRINIEGIGEPHSYDGVPRFGVLFQSGALFSSMTLAENLTLPLTRWTPISGETARELVQAKLDLVGLGPFAEHLPGEISGGMKKRAGIARALMLEADLLFFDEPSAGLDPISAVELDHLILTLSRDLGITIVIVTHELPSIFPVASHCIVLDKVAKGIVA